MINPFRKPHQVYRKNGGRYEGMLYIPGQEIELTIMAGCQPLSTRDMEGMENDSGGRSVNSFIKIYTDSELFTSPEEDDESRTQEPDIIVYRDKRYVITSGGSYNQTQSAASHFKYIAALEIKKS